jgi:hypothetical protein
MSGLGIGGAVVAIGIASMGGSEIAIEAQPGKRLESPSRPSIH